MRSLLLILFFSCLVFTVSGCGGDQEPTPTPTKTPKAMGAAVQQVVQAATATPIPPPPTNTVVLPTPTPSILAPYTGLPVDDPAVVSRQPIFVCINNDEAGRAAHYGLSLADVVYEYIVDGFKVSRISAMYQSQDSQRVGPVRSARYPNLWLTGSYDGALACSGASDGIHAVFRNEAKFPYLDADLDDKNYTIAFQSITNDYRTRLQVSTLGVRNWLAVTGRAKVWNLPGFEFSPEPPSGETDVASAISIFYPPGYGVEWRYDTAAGGYLRTQGGIAEADPARDGPIVAKNVMVMLAPHRLTDIVEDSAGTRSVDITLWGAGTLYVFRNGKVYQGTWRADANLPPRWLGAGDVVIPLQPGQSWVQIIQSLRELRYQ